MKLFLANINDWDEAEKYYLDEHCINTSDHTYIDIDWFEEEGYQWVSVEYWEEDGDDAWCDDALLFQVVE